MKSVPRQNGLIHTPARRGIAVLYKPWGWTPLETLEKFRELNPKLKDIKMTYAGRLDPATEGLLLVLYGSAVHQKEKYLWLDKTYEAEILLGFETDTWDLLGLPSICHSREGGNPGSASWIPHQVGDDTKRKILEILKKFHGEISLPIPNYSSVPINGKPLFTYARRGEKVTIQKRMMEIKKIEFRGLRKISTLTLENRVMRLTKKVRGDFRQEKIAKAWGSALGISSPRLRRGKGRFCIISLVLRVSSGTYIRSIAHELGARLGTAGILYSLKRTGIGRYLL